MAKGVVREGFRQYGWTDGNCRRGSVRLIGGLVALALAVAGAGAMGVAGDPPKRTVASVRPGLLDYARDVRPVLAPACLPCHGADDASRKAGLRLDRPISADVRAKVLRRLALPSSDPSAMPPAAHPHPLPAQGRKLLQRWLAGGAPWSDHWAFRAIRRPVVPIVGESHPVDAFLVERLRKAGLELSPEADRATLLRRAALDLTGLPPSPQDRAAFMNDNRPGAWERAVDRLLASPRYGEHWARMWMDLARYADTKGYEKDLARPMWRWRDILIDRLNADQPFDAFTREQLAGDLLPGATAEQKVATAFHRMTMTNDEGGTDDEEYRQLAVKDRVDTTVQVWMGLTMGCAKCHSHKFDPIALTDYYRFYAIFNQTADADRFDDAPNVVAPTQDQTRRIEDARRGWHDAIVAVERSEGWESWQSLARSKNPWVPLAANRAGARSGATVTSRPDRALLVSGNPAQTDSTTVEFGELPALVTGFQLEVLRDPALAGGGPGRRADDTNAVVSEFRVEWVAEDGSVERVPLGRAKADHSQGGWDVVGAVDGNPSTGWAWAPQNSRPHRAWFAVMDPKPRRGGRWRIVIDQNLSGFVLGCFRISAATGNEWESAAVTAEDPLSGLWVGAGERSWQQREQLALRFGGETSSGMAARIRDTARALTVAEAEPVATPVLEELPVGRRRVTKVHLRGDFLTPGETVAAAVLPGFGDAGPSNPNRLDLANWLVSRQNPLTARVAVNRIWARVFGRGLVETEEDFGWQGASPTHPELLDWLAEHFRTELGWSQKRLLRMLLLSKAWRQSARADALRLARDPDNRLLSRSPRVRLSAEMVRDQALAAAGLLSGKLGGSPAMPPQPAGVWRTVYSQLRWETPQGDERYRRGLYTFWRRTSPYPAMTTFDAGSGEVCVIRRVRTNTPLQALVTLNDPAFVEAAAALGGRMEKAPSKGAGVDLGIQALLGRSATAWERGRLLRLHAEVLGHFRRDPKAALALLGDSNQRVSEVADPGLRAAWTMVGSVLLNCDEALVRP